MTHLRTGEKRPIYEDTVGALEDPGGWFFDYSDDAKRQSHPLAEFVRSALYDLYHYTADRQSPHGRSEIYEEAIDTLNGLEEQFEALGQALQRVIATIGDWDNNGAYYIAADEHGDLAHEAAIIAQEALHKVSTPAGVPDGDS